MYAVIVSGGKQFIARPGEIIRLEKLAGDVGSSVNFGEVLLVGGLAGGKATIGTPKVSSASVEGTILAQGRGEKILIRKMKRRKQYRKSQGHRQEHTEVLVTAIASGSDKKSLSKDEISKATQSFHTQLRPWGGLVNSSKSAKTVTKSE